MKINHSFHTHTQNPSGFFDLPERWVTDHNALLFVIFVEYQIKIWPLLNLDNFICYKQRPVLNVSPLWQNSLAHKCHDEDQ